MLELDLARLRCGSSIFLRQHEVAALLGVDVRAVMQWRCLPRGLPFYKVGRPVVVKRTELLAFLQRAIQDP